MTPKCLKPFQQTLLTNSFTWCCFLCFMQKFLTSNSVDEIQVFNVNHLTKSSNLTRTNNKIWFTFIARKDLPLGIEDRKISDRYLTASSEWNRYHGPRFGRLNTVARGRNKGAWSAKRNNRRQYIMVSFTCNIYIIRLTYSWLCMVYFKGQ